MATSKKPKKAPVRRTNSRRPARAGNLAGPSERARAGLKNSIPVLRLPVGRLPLVAGLALAVVILLAAGLWYNKIYTSPQRVFEGMIEGNLSLSSVTRVVGQPVCLSTTGGATNVIQITYFPKLQARCVTDIVDNSTSPPSAVVVESLGTGSADYEHYASIKKPGSQAAKYDKVYELWLKNGVGSTSQQLLVKSLFNPILFGDLRPQQRAQISRQLKDAYSVDYKRIQKSHSSGRTTYGYNVAVNLVKFSKAWNAYISYYGFPKDYLIKAGTYTNDNKLNINVQVDALSRQVKSVNFQGVSEVYASYGISKPIAAPTKTYSASQLQNTLNSIK
jgi:hypothetical protein